MSRVTLQDKNRRLKQFLGKLLPHQVYRSHDLMPFSTNLSRDLDMLVDRGLLQRLAHGLYMKVVSSPIGLPKAPERDALVKAYLKTDDYYLVDRNDYNSLALGTTQLTNDCIVYNHKRHGRVTLGGRVFVFKCVPRFPTRDDVDFLYIDLLNNLDSLPEDRERVLENFKREWHKLDGEKLYRLGLKYGKVKTKKLIQSLYSKN